MSNSILRRLIVVLALCAFLGAPAASLAGPRSTGRFSEDRTVSASLLSRAWNAVVRVWETASQPSTKAGCSADPYGRCLNDVQTADAGCMIDPNGRCLLGH
jgi:hypothetical protein